MKSFPLRKVLFGLAIILATIFLTLIFTGTSAEISFCKHDFAPFWGICQYQGCCGKGYKCIYVAPDCALCDCDGDYVIDPQ